MSACLFMINSSSLTHKKVEEIERLIEFWRNSSINVDDNNRFECDKAAGFRMNIQIAEFELRCRKNSTTAHSITYRIENELREGAPNLKKALLDASSSGVGYVRFTDKNPNKWFEYITEDDLKKSFE